MPTRVINYKNLSDVITRLEGKGLNVCRNFDGLRQCQKGHRLRHPRCPYVKVQSIPDSFVRRRAIAVVVGKPDYKNRTFLKNT